MFSVALLLLLAAGSCVKSETLTQPVSLTVQSGCLLIADEREFKGVLSTTAENEVGRRLEVERQMIASISFPGCYPEVWWWCWSVDRGRNKDRPSVQRGSTMFSVALILLLTAGCCVYCIDLIQPDSKVVQPGQSLIITCQPSGYAVSDNNYATGWIRQRQGKQMEWIFDMWGGGTFYQNDALKNKFSYSRDTSAGTITITGQNVQTEDTAVYHCVRRPTVIQTTDKPVQKPISQQETLTHK
ncbi:hypothetical protein AMECASPLE_010756, partial [Ameca splendens]